MAFRLERLESGGLVRGEKPREIASSTPPAAAEEEPEAPEPVELGMLQEA